MADQLTAYILKQVCGHVAHTIIHLNKVHIRSAIGKNNNKQVNHAKLNQMLNLSDA